MKLFLDKVSLIKISVPYLNGAVLRVQPVAADPKAEPAIFTLNWLSATGTALLLAGIAPIRSRSLEIECEASILEGAPIFAVEVRSAGDYGPAAESAMARKRADYFAAGTLVVWDVDLLGPDTVRSYSAASPDIPTVFRRGDTALAEPALPGWRINVDELFS